MRRSARWFALVLALSACSSGSPTVAPSPSASPSPTETPPAASPSVPAATSSPAVTLSSLSVRLVTVASGLSSPLALVSPVGARTLYIVEQAGRIMRLEPGGAPQTYLDIRGRVGSGGERGLLGLAFHPNFASNGRLFVNYTNTGGDTRVSEFSGSSTRANAASEKVLLSIEQPYANHNGGGMVFDKRGMLLIATGDGGSGGDPRNNAQSLSTLLGKILRIDVNEGSPYAIPADNPFRSRSGARAEIFAYGLRNPWRIAIDRQDGSLWIGDVGQNQLEEIDVIPGEPLKGGLNFGWRIMEGNSCYSSPGCRQNGLTKPVTQFDHRQGDCAVTGGYVYRGSASPKMRGFYFYGDSCSGFLRALSAVDAHDGSAEGRIVSRTDRSIVSFGEDGDGELYVVMHEGTIMRLTS